MPPPAYFRKGRIVVEMVDVRRLATLLTLAGVVLLSSDAAAIDIAATGSWSPTTTAGDLVSGAGSELVTSYESTAGSLTIDISATTGAGDAWRVDVRRSDTNWPTGAGVVLSIKRIDDGAGSGAISGGTGYQAVTTSDVEFFSGSGDRTDVDIQLKVSSVSLLIAPDNYSTSVVYTVVDTL